MFCCFTEAKFSAWNLLDLVCYSKFGFSRLDLNGNMAAKGNCLARKARDKDMFSTESCQFLFKLALKGLNLKNVPLKC